MNDSCEVQLTEGIVIPKRKMRQSNMELLRLLAMLFVLMLHANYLTLGTPGRTDLINEPLSTSLRVLFEHLAIVAVDVFVLISGWFGINPKWKSLVALQFQTMFLSLLVVASFYVLGQPIGAKALIKSVYPGGAHWFIVAYIGLYTVSPVLNTFVKYASQRQMRFFLLAFFSVELFFGLIYDIGNYCGGYSMLSFMGLYMLAQYVRKHSGKMVMKSSGTYFILYLLTMIASALLFLFFLFLGHSEARFVSYYSPFVIMGSLFLLLAFSRLRIQNRIINWMAASCLSIYLIHCHTLIIPCFKTLFSNLYADFSGATYLLLALICLLGIGLGCILIDQLRIFCWKRLLSLLEKKFP